MPDSVPYRGIVADIFPCREAPSLRYAWLAVVAMLQSACGSSFRPEAESVALPAPSPTNPRLTTGGLSNRAPDPDGDAHRFASLMDACRERFSRIAIDGQGEDWLDWPTLVDRRIRRPERPEDDVREVGVALRGSALKIMVRTAAPPGASVPPLWLDIDAWGNTDTDFHVVMLPQGARLASRSAATEAAQRRMKDEGWYPLEMAIGDVVELGVDLAGAMELCPPEHGPPGSAPKGWIRVRVVMNDAGGATAYYGPTVSTFDLEYERETQVGTRSESVAIECPVAGVWLVSNGPFTRSHEGVIAYDFDRIDGGSYIHEGVDADRKSVV